MAKEIHLFITKTCRYSCPNCCNKQYDIDKIPVVSVEELKEADTILLTGGEPFTLEIEEIDALVKNMKRGYPNIRRVYAYTTGAKFIDYVKHRPDGFIGPRPLPFDGINFSPKTNDEAEMVFRLLINHGTRRDVLSMKSNRLYIFPEITFFNEKKIAELDLADFSNFEIIHREWQEEFKPNGGIFRRLPILY